MHEPKPVFNNKDLHTQALALRNLLSKYELLLKDLHTSQSKLSELEIEIIQRNILIIETQIKKIDKLLK